MSSAFINLDNYNGAPFELYENCNVKNDNSTNMTANFKQTELSNLYFSQSNIDVLQDGIILGIYKITNGTKIPKQSQDELLIVMRSIYLQNSKNLNYNFQEQINELNKKVLKYCIKNINTNLQQYNHYINDITKEKDVLNKPEFVDIKGEKTLMPNHFI